ncbi:DNA adenine methylase [Spiroplasma endosymbiont of Diplazon laetatorius]|uniref:DNA adenine methylase n=1 Tax=Spiroplasma endosymbiont of Diplazon laetatorius TaxID=3066322 RepID=UPI0030D2729E
MPNKFISPLTWPGGKAKQWNLIKRYFPKNTKEMIYVEPFFGGGSVGLNSLRENLFNYYFFNDIDSSLIQFWRWFSLHKILFEKEDFYPYASLNYLSDWSDKNLGTHKLYLMNNNLTFNGQQWGTWTQQRLEQNWNQNKFIRILECQKLLQNNKNKISFLSNSYSTCINFFINKYCFYYLDPPYFSNKGKPYRYRFKTKDWNEFQIWLEKITKSESLFCLSIDDSLETREMFKDYFIYEQEWKYTSSNTKGNKKCKIGKELIITNYEVKNNDLNMS